MRAVVAAIVAAGALLALAPSAGADSPESQYLDTLARAGVNVYDAPAAVLYGHKVCAWLAYGTPESVAHSVYVNTSIATTPTPDSARLLVAVAAETLCPWSV